MSGRSRLASLLQFGCLLQVSAAATWLAWRWHASPTQAIAGALAVFAIAPGVLALEFLILSRVARGDPGAPPPTVGQLARAWCSETAHLFRTFWWRQAFRWRAVHDRLDPGCFGRTPVVLVHGFVCNRGFWTPWMRELAARGHPFLAVNLEPVFGSIDAYARGIGEAVERARQATGRPPLIVAHSMGGLAVRAWRRAQGAGAAVAGVVTIGSPHGGTWLGRFSTQPNGRQMQLRSAWLQQLAADEAKLGAPPPCTCWYTNCDNVVFPASTATLPHADNRFVPGQAHVALAFHPAVLQHCLAVLAELDALRQGESVTGGACEIL